VLGEPGIAGSLRAAQGPIAVLVELVEAWRIAGDFSAAARNASRDANFNRVKRSLMGAGGSSRTP
jgi:hypothetical protein